MNKNYFDEILKDWKSKLQKDEWFFSNIKEDIFNNASEVEAFKAIPSVLKILSQNSEPYLRTELLEILFVLARKSNTTELPSGLMESLNSLENISDSYTKFILCDIKNYYRIA